MFEFTSNGYCSDPNRQHTGRRLISRQRANFCAKTTNFCCAAVQAGGGWNAVLLKTSNSWSECCQLRIRAAWYRSSRRQSHVFFRSNALLSGLLVRKIMLFISEPRVSGPSTTGCGVLGKTAGLSLSSAPPRIPITRSELRLPPSLLAVKPAENRTRPGLE